MEHNTISVIVAVVVGCMYAVGCHGDTDCYDRIAMCTKRFSRGRKIGGCALECIFPKLIAMIINATNLLLSLTL